MKLISIMLVFIVSALSVATMGAMAVMTGREPRFFTGEEGGFSVIVAQLSDIHKTQGYPQRYSSTFKPLATLAGHFDSSLNPSLVMEFDLSNDISTIREMPKDGQYVIVVVNFGSNPEHPDGLYSITYACAYLFMPDEAALVPIKGLDDPRVAETLKRIQEARAHPDHGPNAPKAATQPTQAK